MLITIISVQSSGGNQSVMNSENNISLGHSQAELCASSKLGNLHNEMAALLEEARGCVI